MISATDSVPAVTATTNPKSRFIRRMFDSIAPDYDRLNTWVSMGMDRGWRRKAVKRMPTEGWIVDWCAGTGDMTREYLKRSGVSARVVMCDFSTEMRRLTGKKLADVDQSRCYYVCCDVTHAPFKAGVFDGQMQGFAVRNLDDRAAFFAEVRRCNAPEGRGALVDLAVPKSRLWRWMCNFYFGKIAPRLVSVVAHRGLFAYRYLSESIAHHAAPDEIVNEMNDSGLRGVGFVPLGGGIGAIYHWNGANTGTPMR